MMNRIYLKIFIVLFLACYMSFKSQLQEKLQQKLSEAELDLLPSGFQIIGDIAILNLKPELMKYKKEIGKAVIELYPRLKSVCVRTGAIEGKYREPQIEVVSGENNTKTIHKENNCLYKFDVAKIMFAKGNVSERARLPGLVKDDEIILDMFAGIGYFSVPIAKHARPKRIYSIEWNPIAFLYLKENLKLNKISERVEVIEGDSRDVAEKLIERLGEKFADRVIMGLLPAPKEHLSVALRCVKKRGIIHYEGIVKDNEYEELFEDVENAAKQSGRKVRLIKANKVKNYGPRTQHYTLDVEVE